MVVQGASALGTDLLLLVEVESLVPLVAGTCLLQLEFGRKFLGFHRPRENVRYLGRGAVIGLAWVSASKLYLDAACGWESIDLRLIEFRLLLMNSKQK